MDETTRKSYLLVDGENIDATIGTNMLGRRPATDERPRWERVLNFVRDTWSQPAKGLFFLNSSSGFMPMAFVQALAAMGYRPIPLSGPANVKVVDVAIQRTLEAIAQRADDVVLASHDGDFLPQIRALVEQPGRRVALMGFAECFNNGYAELVAAGLQKFDMEDDAGAFIKPLPRLRIVPIDAFDPTVFL